MSSITPQWKDELRARITLSTVINRTTKLSRAGREWKACCPFHNEATPSFYVNDQKGFYHCFGCGAHGDVISWMTEQRGLSFIDACKELASEAGMEVPAPDPRAAKKAEKRAELIDVTSDAQQWFFDTLRSPQGADAMKYLADRGLKPRTLSEFGFGYAPDSKQALNNALSRFDDRMLVESGMRIKTDEGTTYDRFRGRIMLPIQDARGRVIAFGGRIMAKRDGVAKYLNSPDTPLFDKGRTLYNLHRAAPASRQTGRIVVVEGYMDVVALAQAGFHDSVAPLGTALTETQLEMLWRMVEVPILCFDGDRAGERAAMRAITRALPLLAPMRSLSIVRLPSGMDPDDLVKAQGPDAMKALLAEPKSLLDTLWEGERDAQPLTSPESKAGLKARLMSHVDTIENKDIRALYRRDLLDRFSAFAFPPRQKKSTQWVKTNTPMGAQSRDELQRALRGQGSDLAGLSILQALARNPQHIAEYREKLCKLAVLRPSLSQFVETVLDLPIEPTGQESGMLELMRRSAPQFTQGQVEAGFFVLVDRPEIDEAMKQTINQSVTDTEGAMKEQERLRTLLDEGRKLVERSWFL